MFYGILRIFFTLEYVLAERLYNINNKSVALLRFFYIISNYYFVKELSLPH